MDGIYKINLVPNDLSTEETVLQIADTLDNLNGVIDDVFHRLTNRIKQNTDKTVNLKQRIEITKIKVEKLKGMQKAIKVFSSAKYPSAISHEHYQSVWGLDGYHHEPQKITLSNRSQGQSNEKEIQEKLHFYHVKVAEPRVPKPRKDYDLDAVVENVSTVGELLILDTDECPYFGTPAKVQSYVPQITPAVEHKSLLEAAPSSILNRDILKREIDEYMYAPGMGMVPELEMPMDLPHLPGVAGDVQFAMTSDGSIAPSAVSSPTAVDFTDVGTLPDVGTSPDVEVLPDLKDLDVANVPDVPDAPPPPPPPAPPGPLAGAPTASPPPPPPPPPPPAVVDTTEPRKAPAAQRPPPVVDGRANLMEAIRQAGGAGKARLKSAANTPNAKEAKPPGGDLMADLHLKLSMRRHGISGSVLHTLAGVIPEPAEERDSSPGASSGDDWE